MVIYHISVDLKSICQRRHLSGFPTVSHILLLVSSLTLSSLLQPSKHRFPPQKSFCLCIKYFKGIVGQQSVRKIAGYTHHELLQVDTIERDMGGSLKPVLTLVQNTLQILHEKKKCSIMSSWSQ